MSDELVRPFLLCNYDVRIADYVYALIYTHLHVVYVEERVRKGKRGYVRMGSNRPTSISIPGDFATMSIGLAGTKGKNATRFYNLTVTFLESGSYTESGLAELYALPYGSLPVSFGDARDVRVKGALLHHVQKMILGNFEIDAIRAVIGDLRAR